MEAKKIMFDPANLPMVFHPGETLEEKLIEMGMSVKDFSVATEYPEETIFAVLNGKYSISQEMAAAFESVTGIPSHMWLRQQKRYDEFVASKRRDRLFRASHNSSRIPITHHS